MGDPGRARGGPHQSKAQVLQSEVVRPVHRRNLMEGTRDCGVGLCICWGLFLWSLIQAPRTMHPIAYPLVPEPWRRLCPDSLWTASSSAVMSPHPRARRGTKVKVTQRLGVVGGGLRCGGSKEKVGTGEREENKSTCRMTMMAPLLQRAAFLP